MSPTEKKAPNVPAKPARLSAKKISKPKVVTAPAAMSQASSFKSSLDKKTTIPMEELIANIPGSVAFDIKSYVVNPGYATVFPYLATVAPRFQFYRFKKLHFEFRTRCGTAKEGVVGLSPEYNPEEQTPTNVQSAANVKGAISDVPWRNQVLKCDVSYMFSTANHKMVRNYRGPENLLYDALRFNIWREGQDNTNVIGSLYVVYEVELWGPQIQEILISPRLMSDYYNVNAYSVSTPTTWMAISVGKINDPLGIGDQDLTVNKYFSPPPGAYRITFKGNLTFNNTTTNLQTKVGILNEAATVLVEGIYRNVFSTANGTTRVNFCISCNYVVVPLNVAGPKLIKIAAYTENTPAIIDQPMVTWEYC